MTVWMGIILTCMLLLLLILIVFLLYLIYLMTLITEASGISVSMFERQRLKRKEKKNAELTHMLEEISQKHTLSKSQAIFGDPLDELDSVEEAIDSQKETDPDSILTLLEFGLPDEEFEEALSAVKKDM